MFPKLASFRVPLSRAIIARPRKAKGSVLVLCHVTESLSLNLSLHEILMEMGCFEIYLHIVERLSVWAMNPPPLPPFKCNKKFDNLQQKSNSFCQEAKKLSYEQRKLVPILIKFLLTSIRSTHLKRIT